LNLKADFSYTLHGANPLNPDGSVRENVGGNIALGHRVNDSDKAHFLDGFLEYGRTFSAAVSFEPFKEIFFNLNLRYINQSLQNSKEERFETFFNLSARL
jgi:hypothetical protein